MLPAATVLPLQGYLNALLLTKPDPDCSSRFRRVQLGALLCVPTAFRPRVDVSHQAAETAVSTQS